MVQTPSAGFWKLVVIRLKSAALKFSTPPVVVASVRLYVPSLLKPAAHPLVLVGVKEPMLITNGLLAVALVRSSTEAVTRSVAPPLPLVKPLTLN